MNYNYTIKNTWWKLRLSAIRNCSLANLLQELFSLRRVWEDFFFTILQRKQQYFKAWESSRSVDSRDKCELWLSSGYYRHWPCVRMTNATCRKPIEVQRSCQQWSCLKLTNHSKDKVSLKLCCNFILHLLMNHASLLYQIFHLHDRNKI